MRQDTMTTWVDHLFMGKGLATTIESLGPVNFAPKITLGANKDSLSLNPETGPVADRQIDCTHMPSFQGFKYLYWLDGSSPPRTEKATEVAKACFGLSHSLQLEPSRELKLWELSIISTPHGGRNPPARLKGPVTL